ncbi:MAG: nucleoside deaminase [Phycisphaeraceae bacterium]
MTDDARYMRMALDACRRGVEGGQSPFGACIVRDSQVLACYHNHVWLQTDPTAHAEVVAIRQACAQVRHVHLEGGTIYSTTEPCPMCFSAIHWARIDRIVFAARVEDAGQFGFNELRITNAQMKQIGGATVQVDGDFLRDEALMIYRHWRERGGKVY